MVRQRTSAPLRPALAAGWIAGVLLVLSFLVWGGLRYEESRSARERFDRQASEARDILVRQFQRIEQVMVGAAALFAIKPDLTEAEWTSFVDGQHIPAIGRVGATGIGFLERVTPDRLDEHQSRMRRRDPKYRVWPEGERPVYYPLVLSRQPEALAVAAPFGYDPTTSPERHEALTRALATGKIGYSSVVILKAIDPATGKPSVEAGKAVAMYAPVFRALPGNVSAGVGPDRHLGFVLSAVRLHTMTDHVSHSLRDVAVAVRPPGTRDFIQSTLVTPGPGAAQFSRTDRVEIGGMPWDVRVESVRRGAGWLSRTDLVLGLGLLGAAAVVAWGRAVERRRAVAEADLEASQRANEARFRELADTAPFIAWMATPDLKVTYLNNRWWQFVGTPPMALPEDGVDMVAVHAEDLAEVKRVAAHGEPFTHAVRMRSASGQYRWFLVSGEPVRRHDGTLAGFMGTASDIHEQHETQQHLATSQARYRLSVGSGRTGIWEWNIAAGTLYCSSAFTSMLELDPIAFGAEPDVLGDGCLVLLRHVLSLEQRVHPEDRSTRRDALRALLRDRVPLDIVVRIANAAGVHRYYRLQADGLWDDEGRCTRCAGTVTDITELKLAELEAQRSRTFLDAIVNAIPSPVVVKDQHLRWSMVNAAFEEAFGIQARQVIGRTDADILPPEITARTETEDHRLITTGLAMRSEVLSTLVAGEARWFLKYKSALDIPGDGRYLISVSNDIDARKRAEMEVERSRRFLDAVIEAIPIPVMVRDNERRVLIANEAAARVFALPPDRMIGTLPESMFSEAYCRQARAEDDVLWAQGGGILSNETELPRLGGEPRWMLKTKVGTVLPDGSRYVIAAYLDITERRQMEEALRAHGEHLEELVAARTGELETAKNAAEAANRTKSEFLANMSHELRTPMHAVLSFAKLGADRLDAGRTDAEKLRQYLGRIQSSGGRLLNLLNDLLDLSKLEAGRMNYDFGRHDLRQIVDAVVEEMSQIAREKGITVEVAGGDQPVPVWCDPARIGQVLRNLLGNALKFTPAGRAVRLALGSGPLPFGPGRPGAHLEITDEGNGIPDGELEAVFDKFVQSSKTRSGAGGTGLGLAICREIVTQHGGRIWAEHAPHGGARFVVVMPADEGEAQLAQ